MIRLTNGDVVKKVRCIDDRNSSGILIQGQIYEVEKENEYYLLKENKVWWSKDRFEEVVEEILNVCEHGDHPAPENARFCSPECQQCEQTAFDESIAQCAGICGKGQMAAPVPPTSSSDTEPFDFDTYNGLRRKT